MEVDDDIDEPYDEVKMYRKFLRIFSKTLINIVDNFFYDESLKIIDSR